MANSQEIIQAAADADLLDRALVLGLGLGISEQGVMSAFRRIVACDITVDGTATSIANEYANTKEAYDEAVKSLPPVPGKNLNGVTDEQLVTAIKAYSALAAS